jgi:hypothetical protein
MSSASDFWVNKNRIYLIFWVFIFKIALDYSYSQFVSEFYSYAGMINNLSFVKYIEGWFIAALMGAFCPYVIKKPSDFFITFSLIIYYIPIITFYTFADQSTFFFYVIISTWFFLVKVTKSINVSLPTILVNKNVYIFSVASIVIFLTFFITLLVGVSNINFDLTKEYALRPIVSAALTGYGLPYFATWLPQVLGPLLLCITLARKNYFFFLVISILHIYWFGITSHKTPMFVPFLIFGVWYWFKSRNQSWFIPMGLALILSLFILIYLIFDFGLLASLINRRVFMIPAKLTFEYLTFFDGSYILWSNSFLSSFTNYPYDVTYQKLIGQQNGSGDYANVGFLATGFMHAGIFGIYIYLMIYTLVLKLIDSISYKNIPIWFSIGCLVMPLNIVITSGDLLTAMITHGLVIAIMLLYLSRNIFRKDAIT